MNAWKQKPAQRCFKRLLDISVAVTILLLTSPLLLFVAWLIRREMGSPVLFRQQRPGLDGQPFMLTKFRTMRDAVGQDGKPLPDEKRLTGLGKLLRKTSIDELPQLLNVLKGDMTLVGPRPLLMQYLPLYNERQAHRHDVPPGITGWAQVNGRNTISWEQKFEYDVWYIEHWSFWLDSKILFLTAIKVFRRSDISAGDHATMPAFTGSNEITKSTLSSGE